jgi:hypothetical protein
LFPKEACDASKAVLRQQGWKWSGASEVKVHPLHEGRRVPIKSLIRKLDLEPYDLPAPLVEAPLRPRRLVLPLKQNAGTANRPMVGVGDRVRAGQLVGETPAGALGAPLHAPLAGRVVEVQEAQIVIEVTA